MPKKKKVSVVDTSTEVTDNPEITEISNPNFCFGTDTFELENGDSYSGGFCAHKTGIVWREGSGVYTTKDNHIYEGIWENDQLLSSEETTVKYPDGVEYKGSIVQGKYSGPGTYILENKLPINCTFQENTPVGEAVLIDPQNNLWKGIADEETILLLPENHFYVNLSYDKGIGRKISATVPEDKVSDVLSYISSKDSKEFRDQIFKKSTKTRNAFKESLMEEQAIIERLQKPLVTRPKRKSSLLKARSGSNVTLLKKFFSAEYRNSCPPIPVFYPTQLDE